MKKSNQKKEFLDSGYISFNLNKIDKKNILNSILMLSDGSHFFGTSFGSQKRAIGELCFNTSLTGYQEIITDPSYAGQIITFTFPHIGNIGSNNSDDEGETDSIAGIVVRQLPTSPSNWRSEQSFEDWLILNNIPGISGIDTRLLTKTIRKYKSCNAMICYDENGEFDLNKLKVELNKHPNMDGLNLSSSVSTKNQYKFNEEILMSPSGLNALNDLNWDDFLQRNSEKEHLKDLIEGGQVQTWSAYEEGAGINNPLVVQIAGHDPQTMSETAQIILARTNESTSPGEYIGPGESA